MNSFPTHIRAFIFLLFAFGLAIVFQYLFFRRQVFSIRWSFIWVSITGVAFISENMLILFLYVAVICFFSIPKKGNTRISYYFAMLPMLPTFVYEIPGLPGIRYLFNLTYPRMLALLILLPLFFSYIRQPIASRDKLFSSRLDKFVVFYVLLLSVLAFRGEGVSITEGLRADVLLFLDIFLPYFVISKYINSVEDIKQVFVAILFSAIMLSFVGLFEAKLSWDFYGYLREALGYLPNTIGDWYHARGGFVRIRTTMSPIPFGYFLALVLGIYLYLKGHFEFNKVTTITTLGLILSALYFTGSRGAWLAAMIVFAVYVYLKIRSRQKRIGIIFLGAVTFIGILVSGGGTYTDETGTFEYRIRLVTTSINVVSKNLFFGTDNPNKYGDLEVMRQGQGIIDIVNSYVQVALYSGMVGFFLFTSIFVGLFYQLYKRHRTLRLLDWEDAYRMNAILLALMAATIIMIGTVSSVSFIPIYYWSLIAICSAYVRIVSEELADLRSGESQIKMDSKSGYPGNEIGCASR